MKLGFRVGMLVGVVGAVAFGFMNCSQFEVAPIALKTSLIQGTQCKPTFSEKLSALGYDPAVACGSVQRFKCIAQHFAPGIGNQTSAEQECADIAGLGNVCLTVETTSFDTIRQQSIEGSTPADFVLGGAYNHFEYQCEQSDLKDGEQSLVRGEGETLAAALGHAVGVCRAAGR